jgi:hypothetical protein
MHHERGGGAMAGSGGGMLQVFAAFVRSKGANALIYPSARSDVLAESRLGALTRWRGWCLVDYTGTPDPWIKSAIDVGAGWSISFPRGARIAYIPDGEYRGSFEVQGIVEWNRKRVGEIEAEFLRVQQP